jgi:CBS domain containing-hemolysin-like protein
MLDLLYVLVALALVALNAFFVATEFGIVKVRSTRIEELVSQGVARAQATQEVIGNLNPYLSACQLGITLASLGLGWVGEPAFAHLFERLLGLLGIGSSIAVHTAALVTAFVLITLLHVVLGELVPKTIAIDYPERTALWVAWPIRIFYRVFYPFIWAMNELANLTIKTVGLRPASEDERAHTEEELRMIVARSQRGGVLTEAHASLLARALDFAGHTVRQIIVPRGEIVFLDVNRPYEEILKTARESGHSRYPLCDGDLDRVLGILHIKDLFVHMDETSGVADLRALAHAPLLIPETLPVERLLGRFQRERVHMAIVLDEYGGTTGMVTLEDVIEEIIGEVQDEFDMEEPMVQRMSGGRLSVDATLPVDEIGERLGIDEDLEEPDIDTLGGLVFTRLGRLPEVGDTVVLGGRRVEVSRVDGRRILRVLVHPGEHR